jgi:hypothetical protein
MSSGPLDSIQPAFGPHATRRPRQRMSNLRTALEQNRAAIEAGLIQTERELAELDERRAELIALITRARTALGDGPIAVTKPQAERLTLHEAMELVLRDSQDEWMTVRELADAINQRRLYHKRDGSLVDPSQIHARANKYQAMFEKDGRRLRLTE